MKAREYMAHDLTSEFRIEMPDDYQLVWEESTFGTVMAIMVPDKVAERMAKGVLRRLEKKGEAK